jgi:hypothetical protein
MYLRDLWTSCLRRWPLVLAFLLLTAGVVAYASTVVKPTYESTASVVLIPPPNPEEPDQNLYLGLGGLKQSADVLTNSLMSEQTAKEITDQAPGATYQVEPDWSTSAPILVLTATSGDKASTEAMLEAVLRKVPDNLRALQDSVDIKPANRITPVLVSRDIAPGAVEKTRIRLLGMLGVALLVLSAMLVGAVDGLLLRRSGRRNEKSKAAPSDPEEAASDKAGLLDIDRELARLESASRTRYRKRTPTGVRR